MNKVKAEEEHFIKEETIVENHMAQEIEEENTQRKEMFKVKTCGVKTEGGNLEAEVREDTIYRAKNRDNYNKGGAIAEEWTMICLEETKGS